MSVICKNCGSELFAYSFKCPVCKHTIKPLYALLNSLYAVSVFAFFKRDYTDLKNGFPNIRKSVLAVSKCMSVTILISVTAAYLLLAALALINIPNTNSLVNNAAINTEILIERIGTTDFAGKFDTVTSKAERVSDKLKDGTVSEKFKSLSGKCIENIDKLKDLSDKFQQFDGKIDRIRDNVNKISDIISN